MLEGTMDTGAGRLAGQAARHVGAKRSRPSSSSDAVRRDRLARLSAMSLAGAGRPLLATPEAVAEVTAVARAWLEVIDSGRHAVSWTAAAPALREAIAEDDWETALGAARTPLGRCLERSLRSRAIFEDPSPPRRDQWAVLRFQGRFDDRDDVVETVAVHRGDDQRWRVAAYFVG